MKVRNDFSFLKDNHVIANLAEFIKTLPAGIKYVVLNPIPKAQEQFGGTCGYTALSITTYFWHFFDSQYEAYDARKKNKATPSLAQPRSLRSVGKEVNEYIDGIFDMEVFKKIADKIGYNANIHTFYSTNEFSKIVEQKLDKGIPIILPVDSANLPYAVGNEGGKSGHHVVLIGYLECKYQLYCIIASHNNYFLVSARKLFLSCNNLKYCSYPIKENNNIKIKTIDLDLLKNHLVTVEPKKLHLAATVDNKITEKKEKPSVRQQNNKKTLIIESSHQPPVKKFKSTLSLWQSQENNSVKKITTDAETPFSNYDSFSQTRAYRRNRS